MIDFTVITILAVILLIGFGVWVYILQKNNPGMTLGELFNLKLVQEKVSVFIFAALFIQVGEALVAASIHPPGQAQINPVARLMVHLTISVVAIVANIMAPLLIQLIFSAEAKEKKKRGLLFILAALLTMAALWLPYLNLILIAGGLGEVQQALYFFKFWSPYGGFSAFQAMSYILQATTIATLVHYLLVLIDSLWIAVSPHKAMMSAVSASIFNGKETFDPKEKHTGAPEKNKEKKEQKDLDTVEDGIAFLIKRYGEYSGKDIPDKTNAAISALNKMNTQSRVKISGKVGKLVGDIKAWDSSKLKEAASTEDKNKKNKQFYASIFNLFKASSAPDSAEGFGMTLKAKKGMTF